MSSNRWTEEEITRYFEERLGTKLRPDSKGEATAHCPFHADETPSLSVNVRKGVWHCHAGCGGGTPYDFEMKLEGVDFAEAMRRVHAAVGRIEQEQQIQAEYSYVDERKTLLSQVVRLTPKGFYQRRPDGNGGWINNMKGVRRVPYKLPGII